MSSHPSQTESNAMAAFLASSEGDLLERARLWNEALKDVNKSIKEHLAGGSKDEQTKSGESWSDKS